MIIKTLLIFLLYLFLSLVIENSDQKAFASTIISGISSNEINIDTQFKGSEILLFGAKNNDGDLVIVVRGPKKSFLVNKKEKLLGIWHNGQRMKFEEIPTFYHEFSNLENKKDEFGIFHELEIGKGNLTLLTTSENNEGDKCSQYTASRKTESKALDEKNKNPISEAELNSLGFYSQKTNIEFKNHLISKLEEQNLYEPTITKIDFFDETLFKVAIKFPKNIVLGSYSIEIYLLNNGELLTFQTIPVYVRQIGLSAKISEFANQQPVIYGVLAILFALLFGWLVNLAFARFLQKK